MQLKNRREDVNERDLYLQHPHREREHPRRAERLRQRREHVGAEADHGREAVPGPQSSGFVFGIGGHARLVVDDPGEIGGFVVAWPPGVTHGGEPGPGAANRPRQFECRDVGLWADQQCGRPRGEVAERQRQSEAVAGAEQISAHARCLPADFIEVMVSPVCLREVQGGHSEQIVGVHQFVEGFRVGIWVASPECFGVGGQQGERGVRSVAADSAQFVLEDHEQPVLVARVADDEVDVGRSTGGECLPRSGREDLTVDDGGERRADVGCDSPAPFVDDPGRDDVGCLVQQFGRQSPNGVCAVFDAEEVGDRRADIGCEVVGEEETRDALEDRTVEQPLGGGHRKQRGDAAGAGGFAEHGHRIMVSAESGDVLLHPAQRCNLIEEPTVGRSTREGREPFGVQPVVERHHDDSVGG
mgnify:CR=1 FL=1